MAIARVFFSSSFTLRRSRFSDFISTTAPKILLFEPQIGAAVPSIRDGFLGFGIGLSRRNETITIISLSNNSGITVDIRQTVSEVLILDHLGLSAIHGQVPSTLPHSPSHYSRRSRREVPSNGSGGNPPPHLAGMQPVRPRHMNIVHASVDGVDSVGSTSLKSVHDADFVPMPIVLIDQDSDSDATIVQVSFGDRLGALIDTMKALRDLGLDVAKGTVTTEGSEKQTKFFITRLPTGRKVEDPDLLERIRLTIINNLLKYHPESSERLAMGEAFGIKAPEKKLDVDIATHIYVKEDGPKRSLLCIETADRPGLLLEIIKIMADININVESAEIDTEGLVAKDKFHVSYRGAALNSSLSQVLINCLRYYLRRPETGEDSY
ncbi:ACT domain-containing protein [Actinidia rufa]|uniref:ACT domain-containing protein ACR n=1 Tax=Actinidia rufa TaxID=165716 RepID=A0A7J0GKH0_9ERIC|nr:ACT domain-containing protein [Actinidia rufa]